MLDMPDFNTTGQEPPRAPTRGGGLRATVLVVLLAATVVLGVRHYMQGPSAVAAADRRLGVKPTLMMFTADWCEPCQQFKRTVWNDDRVLTAAAKSCRFQIVDLSKWEGEPAATATRYGVDAVPTLLMVNSRGQEFARYNGPYDPEQFAQWVESYAP
jgi:thiol:disulfide interchange protein